jgi:hypothetical protein
MYGMINKAVRGLVLDVAGEEAWTRIRQAAGVPDDDFISMEGYDDCVTYRLVAAVSEELSMPPEEVLEAFGKYWLQYTGDEGYGALMESAGSTLPEFLSNLDLLHSRVKLTFSNLVPPRFSVDEQGEGHLILHYYSEREGLEPLVVGLLKGLAERFGQSIEIEGFKESDHAAFHVRYAPLSKESTAT